MEDVIRELSPVLKVREVAAFFKVRPQAIYEKIQTGDIACLRLGPHSLRIPRSEVERLLAQAGQRHPMPAADRVGVAAL